MIVTFDGVNVGRGAVDGGGDVYDSDIVMLIALSRHL